MNMMLEARDLTKLRPGAARPALDRIVLSVAKGELVVIQGASGSGKTALLRMIAGLETADGGTLHIEGRDAGRLHPRERAVALVHRRHALYPHLSIYENLAFGVRLDKRPAGEADQLVRRAAEWLGLTPMLDRTPATLDAAERLRLAIGRAMARQPRLLLLDDPLADLAAPVAEAFAAELASLHRSWGITMILAAREVAPGALDSARRLTLADGKLA